MKRAFTLIELLIVVAIIAILAAIAVPNFLEAQVRSKVSRVKADMRTLATGLESYRIDNNSYPTMRLPRPTVGDTSVNETLGVELTTPIAYLSSMEITKDIFKLDRGPQLNALPGRDRLIYRNNDFLIKTAGTNQALIDAITLNIEEQEGLWRLISSGPDRYVLNTAALPEQDFASFNPLRNYDPTNGTISIGDIFRTQKFSDVIAERP